MCLFLNLALSFSPEEIVTEDSAARASFREKLLAGTLDEQEIELEVAVASMGVEIMAPLAWKK